VGGGGEGSGGGRGWGCLEYNRIEWVAWTLDPLCLPACVCQF
jgi:hypothetical protein